MANQPSNIEPYIQPENQVTRDPLEKKATNAHNHGQFSAGSSDRGGGAGAHRTQPQDGIPSSLGYGVRSSGPFDAQEARATADAGQKGDETLVLENENVEAEQSMATLGEGEVADAVARKSGTQQAPGSGPAEEPDFASDLDRWVLFSWGGGGEEFWFS